MGEQSLREALEALASRWSERSTGYDEYRELSAVLSAHRTPPSPTREQIEAVIVTNSLRSSEIEDQTFVEGTKEDFADAILALLGGPQ